MSPHPEIAAYCGACQSMAEIREFLDAPSFSPGRVIELHIARIRERIELERRLCDRLEAVADLLATAKDPGENPPGSLSRPSWR